MLEVKGICATLYYNIDDDTAEEFLDWVSENENASELILFIDCYGGINSCAKKMLKAINEFNGIFTTVNCGLCASAAVDIFLAGNRRLSKPNVDFMIHKVVLITPSDCILTISDLEKYLKRMTRETEATFRYISKNCALTKEILMEKTANSAEWHFDENTALKYKIVSEIIEEK